MIGSDGRPIRKFNPGTLQSDAELTEQFVVRYHEFGVLTDVLRGNIESPSCQHALIVGPRGRGKTMLLARTAAEIRTVPELAGHLLPVPFMEESQEIFSLTDFWLETLSHLARECASEDPGLAQELRDRHEALSERWREQTLEERARAAVLEAADRLDRKLVLMVENLQSLSKDVDRDFGWKLRGVLQTEPRITLLASATSRFTGLDDAEQPFFEMFRIINLRPLTTEECRSLWKVVSGDGVSGREMRPLEILTGGSPRLLVIVAGFARHRSLRRLMEELVMLIDEHTEYFRGHLEVLGKTERRVYIAVLDLWQRSTAGEIADRARLDVRAVSTMLGRLVERGAVVVEGGGRKRTYAAAEPLYCIYYKLRRGRGEAAVVESLIRFMTAFYNETERTEIFPALIADAAASPAMQYGLERAAAGLPEFAKFFDGMRRSWVAAGQPLNIDPGDGALKGPGEPGTATVPDRLVRVLKEISAANDQNNFEMVVDIVDRSTDAQEPASDGVSLTFAAWAQNMKGDACAELGDPDAAISAYEEVAERFGANHDVNVRAMVARALASMGYVQERAGDSKAAISAYRLVVADFGGSENRWHREWVARALLRSGHIRQEQGDWIAARSAYEEVEERFGTDADVEMKQFVASALNRKGDCMQELGDLESALATYEEIIARFSDDSDMELQQGIAEALMSKGRVQVEQGDLVSAASTYGEVVERFGTNGDVELDWYVAGALHGRGDALLGLEDPERALAVFDAFLERFGTPGKDHLHQQVAETLFSKGQALRELNRPDTAVSAYRQVVERFGSSTDATLLQCVVGALAWMGRALLESGDPDAAIVAFDEIVKRFGTDEDPMLQQWVAMTTVDKANTLMLMQRTEAALHACQEFEARAGNLPEESKRYLTRLVSWIRTRALLAQKDLPAAMEMFRSLYEASMPVDDLKVGQIVGLVAELIAGGASEHELLQTLSADRSKADALAPLLVALRLHAGETVRAPEEVLKVAADIRKRFQEDTRRHTGGSWS